MSNVTHNKRPFASTYVETKIGVLPSSWQVISLEELSDPSAPIRYGVVQIGPDTPDGIPIVPIKHINRIGSVALHCASPEIETAYAGSRVKGGDVLISVKGTIGAVGVVPKGFEGNIAREIARIRPTSTCDANFLALQLEADNTQRRIDSKVVGSTRLEFSIHAVRDFLVALPPLPEQRVIAALLMTWNTAIQKTEQLIAAKERRYSHELSRLISRDQHPHGHIGAFAEEVSARNRGGSPAFLGDILTESREPDTEQDSAKRLTVRLHLQGVEPRPVRGTESDGATAYFRRRAGQLIYGKQNIFRGAIGIVPPELDGFASTQDLPAFDIADGIDPQWLYFWLSRKDFYASLEALAAGSGSKRLHPEEFFKIRVIVPDLAMQTVIARYLSALREEIDLLGQSIAALKTQKRGLMQKLLTGQWRLPIIEGTYG